MSSVFVLSGRGRETIPALPGIGLRFQHHDAVITQRPRVAWFEVHSENYMGGGAAIRDLEAIRRDYPVSLHGVGLSLGGAEGLDAEHLGRLVRLVERIEPGLVSEHLSWSVSEGHYLGDLLPLPLTEEALDVVCDNVHRFQEAVRRQILLENPSNYLQYRHSTISESEFLGVVVQRTGCGILCDVNNIFVNAVNHGWDAQAYLNALPPGAVKELHLAGHAVKSLSNGAVVLIDDHGSQVDAAVWELFDKAVQRFGPLPTLIEWDTNIPPLQALLEQANHAAIVLLQRYPASAHGDVA